MSRSAQEFEDAFIEANPLRWGYNSKKPRNYGEGIKADCLVCGKTRSSGSVFCDRHSTRWTAKPREEKDLPERDKPTVYEWAHDHPEFNGQKLWWLPCAICDEQAANKDYMCHTCRESRDAVS